jgi:hypothetical protein
MAAREARKRLRAIVMISAESPTIERVRRVRYQEINFPRRNAWRTMWRLDPMREGGGACDAASRSHLVSGMQKMGSNEFD